MFNSLQGPRLTWPGGSASSRAGMAHLFSHYLPQAAMYIRMHPVVGGAVWVTGGFRHSGTGLA